MSLMIAISAFTHRTARRSTALQLLLYSSAFAVLLVLLSAWIISQATEAPGGDCRWEGCPQLPSLSWSVMALADVFALALTALGLFVLAPAAVAAAVAAERRAGTLDQLRTTPLSPIGLVAGIVVGTPAKLYLLLCGPLALHIVCGLTGVIPVDALGASLCVLSCGGLASVMIGLAVALAPRQETGGALVALAVAALLGGAALIAGAFANEPHSAPWAFLHPGGALSAALLQHDGLWRRLSLSHWRYPIEGDHFAMWGIAPLLSCLSSLALSAVLGAACCKKLAAPHLPLLSKPQALGLFVGAAVAAVAPARAGGIGHDAFFLLAFALLLFPVALMLGIFTAPTFEAWALALRRHRRIGVFSADAAPHATVWLMLLALGAVFIVCLRDALWWEGHQAWALLWTGAVGVTLPIYIHFLATRYATPAARWAFGVACFVHLLCQAIAIGLVAARTDNLELTYVRLAALVGVAVPIWVAVRQLALRRRTLAAAAAPA